VLDLILAFWRPIRVFFRGRVQTFVEVLALRQELAVLKRKTAATGVEQPGSAVLDEPAAGLAAMV
jgi:hypothetical protein